MKKKLCLALVLCLALTLALVGCGGKNLADFAKQQNDIFATSNSDAMSIEAEAEGATLIYTFKYGIELDATAAQAALDTQKSAYASVISDAEAAGYKVDAIKLVILSKDGSELASTEVKK